MKRIVRINVTDYSIISEDCPPKWESLGGRALISKIMEDEVDPLCNPLGQFNKLIIAPGNLAGTTASCVNRLSIGAKSPLTGGIKESNAGGTVALRLARLGIKALIIEGHPSTKELKLIHIAQDGMRFVDAEDFRGMGVYQCASIIFEKYEKNPSVTLIGPTGERLQLASGITNTDVEGVPSRYAGRGGLGAVMGAKQVKAIVIDDISEAVSLQHDKELFRNTVKAISAIVKESELASNYAKYGTPILVDFVNSLNALATKNFSTGKFEGAEEINAERMYDLITKRKGEGSTTHACMPGCLLKCSNIYPDESGKAIVSPIEFETLALMGSNLLVTDLDAIAKMNYMCNDFGLDTVETGAALGVLMEAGVLEFGDAEKAVELLAQVGEDTYLGRIIAAGAGVAGKVFGVTRVPVVKNQALPAYDPRAIKGLGVTYATSPMGADHTAGHTMRSPVNHLKPDQQAEVSKKAQITNTVHDCIGTCFFLGNVLRAHPNGELALLCDLLQSMTGLEYKDEDLQQIAKDTLTREKQFNINAGLGAASDLLPEFFYFEENPATGTVFDVPREEMSTVHDYS